MLTSDFRTAFNPAIIGPFYVGALTSLFVGAIDSRRFFKIGRGRHRLGLCRNVFQHRAGRHSDHPARLWRGGFAVRLLDHRAPRAAADHHRHARDGAFASRRGAALQGALVRGLADFPNPLLWGVGLGLLANAFSIVLPEPGMAFFDMMSAAVLPAALFGLGGALNEYKLSENWAQAAAMSVFKLIIHPTIAYVLMIHVLHVPMDIARYGILLAAMPSGINAYVFATYYDRAVGVAANVVLITTVTSIVTITAWLYFLGL